jgi:hypothetical protein
LIQALVLKPNVISPFTPVEISTVGLTTPKGISWLYQIKF